MAKIARKTQKIFCGNPTEADQTSVYGTMVDNATRQYSTDVEVLQSNPAYEEGWKSAVQAGYKPFMEDFNTLNYINTSQLAYIFQQGIPEWDDGTTYYTNSFCSYTGKLWKSLINDNLNNTPEEGEKWTEFKTGDSGKGAGLELCDIGTALFVDETKGLRRYLNGTILDINTNTQPFLNRLLEIKNTNPDYFTDETNWQAEKALNVDGCVYKFVLNYDDDGTTITSVRLPKYPEYVEIDSAQAPVIGNGMTLGLLGAKGKFSGLCNGSVGSTHGMLYPYEGEYGVPAGTTRTGSGTVTSYPTTYGISTDPTKSGIVANLTQTKLKLRYFIQIATGRETQNDIINEIQLNNPYVLFDNKYVEAPLYNLSWLKSDGEYKPKATYPKAYEALVVEQNTDIAVGTTVDLPSGTKYTKRGLSVKLSTDESATDYDFRINTTDETFRLPLISHRVLIESKKATTDDPSWYNIYSDGGCEQGGYFYGVNNTFVNYLKNYSDNTTPNIQVTMWSTNADRFATFASPQTNGFTLTTQSTGNVGAYWRVEGYINLSTITTSYNLYYYIGETVQNANLINAGRIGEQIVDLTTQLASINSKVDSYINKTVWSGALQITVGTTSLSSLLPNDGNKYLVYGSSRVAAKSSAVYIQKVSSDIATTAVVPCCADGDDGRSSQAYGFWAIPVGTGRKITLEIAGEENWIVGYYRL